MDNFVDTCVIFDNFDEKSKLHLASKKFVESKKKIIISEYQKIKEIPYLFFRLKMRSKVVVSKALMPSKDIPEIKKLNFRDRQEVKEILSEYALGLKTIKDLFDMKKEVFLLEKKLNIFIETKIKRVVTPIKNINIQLAKDLKNFNKNEQDSMVIASAIEEHQKADILLATSDKKDWKQMYITKSCQKNSYKKIPEVKFIQDL
jgi:hypothetical protein